MPSRCLVKYIIKRGNEKLGEKSSAKIDVREYLQSETLLFDGAMGTYLSQLKQGWVGKVRAGQFATAAAGFAGAPGLLAGWG